MKKIMMLSVVVLAGIVLAGCGKEKTPEVAAPEVAAPSVQEPIADEVVPTDDQYAEYQLDIDIVSTDTDGNEYGVKTKMFKKGDKSLYVIDEMTGPQELPFTPTQNLLVGTDLYSNIEVNGESMRFKADSVQDQADAMFDLAKMQEEVHAQIAGLEKFEEEIDGVKMDCYATIGTGGKICLLDGLFSYGEDFDPASGMSSVIKVKNYSDTVDDSVFVVPAEEDVRDMSEFMQLMMAQLQEEVPEEAPLPEEVVD